MAVVGVPEDQGAVGFKIEQDAQQGPQQRGQGIMKAEAQEKSEDPIAEKRVEPSDEEKLDELRNSLHP